MAVIEAGGVGPGEGGRTALHRVNEGPINSPEAAVTSLGMAALNRDEAGQRSTSPSRRLPPGAGALGAVVGPFTRTGSYYAQSWRDYLDRTPRDLPVARPSIALAAHAFRDEIVLLGLRARRPVSDVHTYGRFNAEVVEALDFYGRRRWLDQPARFFAKPPPLTDVTIRPVKASGRSYERIAFDSGYTPRAGEPGRQRWLGYSANNREYALLLRHKGGIAPGSSASTARRWAEAALDLALFRAWHLHEGSRPQCGLARPSDAPGPRGTGAAPNGAVFPGEDVMDNVHATAQAVWDIRRLLSWIRSQQPESPIGMYSISLGGYVTSLVASLEQGLTCAILGVPVADLIGLLGRHAGFRDDDPRRLTVTLAEPIGRMMSPLSLEPRVPMRGRFIYAGIADRLVHPREQVVRLWEHWGKPEIVSYHGGHTGFFQSRPVQQFIDAALVQSGLLDGSAAMPESDRSA